MNVLLVRADGIGDALACAPLLAALRAAGHDVGAVLGASNREIFARRAFAHVHVLERIPWPRHGSTEHSRSIALAGVRAARYDVALIASEEIEAYRFACSARIARRVGFVNAWEKPLKTVRVRGSLTRAVVRPASARRAREHEVDTLFRLGAGLHAEAVPTRDPARLAPLVLDEPAVAHGRIVVQVSRKLAPDGLGRSAYVALARALERRGHGVLLVGDEPVEVAAVAAASGADAEAPLGLAAWKARIAGARALVTPDSGAAHVAGMLGVPCVDVFPAAAASDGNLARWRPWAAPHRTVVLDRRRAPAALAEELATAADVLAELQPA